MSEQVKIKPYSLRLEEKLKSKAEKQAMLERRSLNNWLIIAIEEKLRRVQEGAV